jgi:hypothetical protein
MKLNILNFILDVLLMCAIKTIINDITANLKKEFKKCLLMLASETYQPTNSKSWFIKQ